MPMRKLTLHTCLLGVTLCASLPASAAESRVGSYAADGNCYCADSVGREIDSRIVPTPIGGQSVAQICERVGKGPALQKVNGKFNFTVYADAQCGHGPALNASNSSDSCLGNQGIAGEDCQGAGPEWDLKAAYASTPGSEAISDDDTSQGSYALGQSRYIAPPADIVSSGSASSDASYTKELLVAESASVTQITKTRSSSTQIQAAEPVTPEQLRERQLVQMEAARERARIKAGGLPLTEIRNASAPDSELEIILTEEQKIAQAEAEAEVVAELAAASKEESTEQALSETAETIAQTTATSTPAVVSAPVSALKLPAGVSTKSRDFDFVEGLPVNYDFGGAGIGVSASASHRDMLHFNLNAVTADSYQEASIGAGIYLTPESADRLTVVLNGGIEYGKLDFQNAAISTDLSDTGAFFGLSSRLTINHKFELQGGIRFSSLFEGDAALTGAAFYHLTPHLDLTTKAELGDNDMLGLGIRFYY